MQRIIEGNIGSGKSLYAIKYIMDHFCTYDDFYDEFIMSDTLLLITNLDGLKLKHLNLQEMVDRYTVEGFFTVENFERIQKQYKAKHIILIVDEAQKFFDVKFYNKDVFFLFEYQRHLGLDVLLITQHRSKLCKGLIPLCEYIIQAQERTKSLKGVFRYKFLDTKGTFLYNRTIRGHTKYFRAYKSFTTDEIQKPVNLIVRYIVGLAIVGIFVLGCSKYVFSWFKVRSENKQIVSSVKHTTHLNPSIKAPLLSNPSVPVAVQKAVSSVRIPHLPYRTVKIDSILKDGAKIKIMLAGIPYVFTLPCREIRSINLVTRTAEIEN